MTNHPNRAPEGNEFHRRLFLSAYAGRTVVFRDTAERGVIRDAVPHRSGLKPLRLVIELPSGVCRTVRARDLVLSDV